MNAPRHATIEGTRRYQNRFKDIVSPGHFRSPGDLSLSSIGLGTYLGEYNSETDEMYRRAVKLAIQSGCNVIDTAINYRFQRSERAVGDALSDLLTRGEFSRDELVVATKGGFIPFEGEPPSNPTAYFSQTFALTGIAHVRDMVAGCHVMTANYIRHQLEASLKNLKLECIDIYFLHNPEIQLQEVDRTEFRKRVREAFSVLEESVKSGRIRMYGTATWNGYRVSPKARDYLSLMEMIQIAEEVGGTAHHFKVIQLPYSLSMPEAFSVENQVLHGKTATVLEVAQAFGMTVMASASISQGRLSGGLPGFIQEMLMGLETDAQRAVQFVRSTPGVAVALIGMKQLTHVEENMATAKVSPVQESQVRKLFSR